MTIKPTHKSGHILDLVITRLSDNVIFNVHSSDPLISDHKAILFSAQLQKTCLTTKTIKYQPLSKINYQSFNADLNLSDLMNHPHSTLIELALQYDHSLTAPLDKHSPIKSKTITE